MLKNDCGPDTKGVLNGDELDVQFQLLPSANELLGRCLAFCHSARTLTAESRPKSVPASID